MGKEHSHGEEGMSDGRLVVAVALNVLLTLAQIVGGIVSGSLALIADALHNFSDAASLGLALFARRIGRRPADRLMTFGYARAEVVAALINLTTLLVVGLYLLVEAVARYADPQPIEGWTVIGVAGIALVIDAVTAVMVYSSSKGSINMKAAFLHNVSDALASVGVIIAGVLILLYDLYVADLVITVLIAAYVIWQGLTLMPRTVRLLMGAVPDDVEFDAVVAALTDAPGVKNVHHVHVWSISENIRSLEAHIVPEEASLEAFERLKSRLRTVLAQEHRIAHATLEPCLGPACEGEIVAAHEAPDAHGAHDHAH